MVNCDIFPARVFLSSTRKEDTIHHRPDQELPQPPAKGRRQKDPELPVGCERGRYVGRRPGKLLPPGRAGQPYSPDG